MSRTSGWLVVLVALIIPLVGFGVWEVLQRRRFDNIQRELPTIAAEIHTQMRLALNPRRAFQSASPDDPWWGYLNCKRVETSENHATYHFFAPDSLLVRAPGRDDIPVLLLSVMRDRKLGFLRVRVSVEWKEPCTPEVEAGLDRRLQVHGIRAVKVETE
jgi:hypothetical protein